LRNINPFCLHWGSVYRSGTRHQVSKIAHRELNTAVHWNWKWQLDSSHENLWNSTFVILKCLVTHGKVTKLKLQVVEIN